MAIYRNSNADSPVTSVEFAAVPQGNVTFIKLKEEIDQQGVKQWLAKDLGQTIEAEAEMGRQTVLVTHGAKSQQEIVQGLREHGVTLQAPQPESAKFRPWVWRGNISIAGQSLQLASGMMAAKKLTANEAKELGRELPKTKIWTKAEEWNPKNYKKGKMDIPVIIFAVSNLLANFTNIVFGAQKSEDTHQLAFLKKKSNEIITSHLPEGHTLPAIEEKRAALRKEAEKPKSLGGRAYAFMERNSVRIGEIGLRYFGAIALAFPVNTLDPWKKAAQEIRKGELRSSVKTIFNKDKFTGWTGVAYLAGKTIAMFSKVPDPYDTHKHTFVDTVREKVLFPLSSATEAVAAGLLAWNGFANKKIFVGAGGHYEAPVQKIDKGLSVARDYKLTRDYPGGIGGALFSSGLLIRILAPFGRKNLNMDELNAHITDSLAQLPPEQLPQALAQSAAFLTAHFGEQKVEFGQTYRKLATDLYRYHKIALPGAEGTVGVAAQSHDAQAEPPQRKFATPELISNKPDIAARQPASFQERATAAANAAAAIGMSMT